MTVGTVPSEMRTPVGFDGAGTSPMFLADAVSALFSLAWTLCTTDAGGIRHPSVGVAKMRNGESFTHGYFESTLMFTVATQVITRAIAIKIKRSQEHRLTTGRGFNPVKPRI